MSIRITNKWCAPMVVDLGQPLGPTRLSKAMPTELDIEFNDLKLPKRAAAMVAKGTLVVEDLDLPEDGAEKGSGAKAPAQGPKVEPSAAPGGSSPKAPGANSPSRPDQNAAPVPKASAPAAKAPEKKDDSK